MDEVTRARLAAQLLDGGAAASVEDVVGRLQAVQAQDARGMRLAVRARSSGLSAADVDRALTESRTVVVAWLNRGTLHLVPAADYWWLHALTTPGLRTSVDRRLRQTGVDEAAAARGIEVVVGELRSGPRSRHELRQALADAGVPTAGQAFVHVLYAASLAANVVRGPVRGADHCYVLAADWLARPPEPVHRDEALRLLARRYLTGHGPASARDLATWAGIGLGDARRGLAGCPELPDGHYEAPGHPGGAARSQAPAKLLGAFDPLLCGWASKEPVLGRHTDIASGGMYHPFVLVAGRAVGRWSLRRDGVELDLRESVTAAVRAQLREEAADVRRFLSKKYVEPPPEDSGTGRT